MDWREIMNMGDTKPNPHTLNPFNPLNPQGVIYEDNKKDKKDKKDTDEKIKALEERLFALADWIDNPISAPIEERKKRVPEALRLIKEIDRLEGNDNNFLTTITIILDAGTA